MSKKYSVAVGVLLAVLSGAGVVWFSRQSPEPGPVSALPPGAPANSAHEMASLEEELKKKPGHSPILIRLAELNQQAGRPAEAIRYLRRVVEAEPSNVQERLELGRALYDSGDVKGAIEQTLKILETDPQNVDALYNLGAIYGNEGNVPKAKGYFSRAVAVDASSDSGRKARAGLVQLESPVSGPTATARKSQLPPGHPPLADAPSSMAIVDRLLQADSAREPKK